MNIFKRSVLLFMIAVVLSLPMITHTEGIDLRSYAMSNLTELLGFTAEEAAQFVFDETNEGTIAFWIPIVLTGCIPCILISEQVKW